MTALTVILNGNRAEARKHIASARARHNGFRRNFPGGAPRVFLQRIKSGVDIRYSFNPDSIRITASGSEDRYLRATTDNVVYASPFDEEPTGELTIYSGGSLNATSVIDGPTFVDTYIYGNTTYDSDGRGPKQLHAYTRDIYRARREAYDTEYFDGTSVWHFTEYWITEDAGRSWWGFLSVANEVNDLRFAGVHADGYALFILQQGSFFYRNDETHTFSSITMPAAIGTYTTHWLHGRALVLLNAYTWDINLSSERFYTTDAGDTWSADTGFPETPTLTVPYVESALDAAGGIIAVQVRQDFTGFRVYTSADYGETWLLRGELVPALNTLTTSHNDPKIEPLGNNVFLFSCYNENDDTIGLYLLEDSGASVSVVPDPFSNGVPESYRGAANFRNVVVFDYRGVNSKVGVVVFDSAVNQYYIYAKQIGNSSDTWERRHTLNIWPDNELTFPRDAWKVRDEDGTDFLASRPFKRLP